MTNYKLVIVLSITVTVLLSPGISAEEAMVKQTPEIVELAEKKLVGVSLNMTRAQDQTPILWRSFMPRRAEVPNRSSSDFISMQVYPGGPAQVADPTAQFTKWAVVEVESFESVPEGMQTYTLTGGRYAVFQHNGPATDLSTIMYIFGEWLPNSEYQLDDREHFEVLGEDYRPMDPQAQEKFWIPIK